jgi:hypothetical protein
MSKSILRTNWEPAALSKAAACATRRHRRSTCWKVLCSSLCPWLPALLHSVMSCTFVRCLCCVSKMQRYSQLYGRLCSKWAPLQKDGTVWGRCAGHCRSEQVPAVSDWVAISVAGSFASSLVSFPAEHAYDFQWGVIQPCSPKRSTAPMRLRHPAAHVAASASARAVAYAIRGTAVLCLHVSPLKCSTPPHQSWATPCNIACDRPHDWHLPSVAPH